MTGKENKRLAGAILVCLLLVFATLRLGIGRTLSEREKYRKLRQAETLSGSMQAELSRYRTLSQQYDSLLAGRQAIEADQVPLEILERIGRENAPWDMKLQSFDPSHVFIQQNLCYETVRFTLEGTYASSLKFIHDLEKDSFTGKVLSVGFSMGTGVKQQGKLFTTIIIQNTYDDR